MMEEVSKVGGSNVVRSARYLWTEKGATIHTYYLRPINNVQHNQVIFARPRDQISRVSSMSNINEAMLLEAASEFGVYKQP